MTPNYFRSMGIRLLRGRELTDADNADAPKAVVISETMARRYFPDEDPLGKRLVFGGGKDLREIVGVTFDVKFFGLNVDARPSMYFPHAQSPARGMSLVVRAQGDPMALAAAIRGQVSRLDRELAVSNVVIWNNSSALRSRRPIHSVRCSEPCRACDVAFRDWRSGCVLLGDTAGRTRSEVRMALGAQRRDVVSWLSARG